MLLHISIKQRDFCTQIDDDGEDKFQAAPSDRSGKKAIQIFTMLMLTPTLVHFFCLIFSNFPSLNSINPFAVALRARCTLPQHINYDLRWGIQHRETLNVNSNFFLLFCNKSLSLFCLIISFFFLFLLATTTTTAESNPLSVKVTVKLKRVSCLFERSGARLSWKIQTHACCCCFSKCFAVLMYVSSLSACIHISCVHREQ